MPFPPCIRAEVALNKSNEMTLHTAPLAKGASIVRSSQHDVGLPVIWGPLFRATAPAAYVGAVLLSEARHVLRAAGPPRERQNRSRSGFATRRNLRLSLLYLLHAPAPPPRGRMAKAVPAVFPIGH